MVQLQPAAVLADQREGGAGHGDVDAQGRRKALREARFPGAEIAVQGDDGAGLQRGGQLGGQLPRLLRAFGRAGSSNHWTKIHSFFQPLEIIIRRQMSVNPQLSVVVPVYNEEESVDTLCAKLHDALSRNRPDVRDHPRGRRQLRPHLGPPASPAAASSRA